MSVNLQTSLLKLIVVQGRCKCSQYKIWTADCGLRTTDYGLRTGYEIWTRYKTRTGKYGLGIKHGLGIKRELQTGFKYGLQTTLVVRC